MIRKQTLGWIGASVAAGLYPTFSMSFAAETLASTAGSAASGEVAHGGMQDEAQPWPVMPASLSIDAGILRPSAG